MEEQQLQGEYNRWWKDKTIQGENIDAAKRMYRDILKDLQKHHISVVKQPKILDVACGTGEFLVEAQKLGMDVYGVDLSSYAISFAKKHTDGTFLVGNGEKLSFKVNTFDYVTCIGSLEHFPHPEKGILEMARVLKKDSGRCIIHVPNLMFLGHIYMTYRYGIMPSEGKQSFSETFYTYEGWKNLLEKNGLSVIKCSAVNDMSKTEKVSRFTKFIWQALFRHVAPFHLSYAFNFYCRKK